MGELKWRKLRTFERLSTSSQWLTGFVGNAERLVAVRVVFAGTHVLVMHGGSLVAIWCGNVLDLRRA
jgi:hypothetical protein